MANRRIIELVQEALAVRARAYGPNSDSTWVEVKKRMHELRTLAATVESNEVRRHVIVASIATLQTFVRFSISEIVNSGAQYRLRAAERIPEKYSVKDVLMLLDDQTISFGELVAHIASYNSVTDVTSWLGAILGLDLKSALSDARSHYMLRRGSKGAPLLVADVDQLLADVENTFRLRHILAHEMAYGLSIESEECRRLVGAVDRFIAALNAVIWNTAYTEAPLSPEEFYARVSEARRAARSELAMSLFRAREVARILGSSAWLRKSHLHWVRFGRAWVGGGLKDELVGPMPEVLRFGETDMILRRAAQVAEWLAFWGDPLTLKDRWRK
ncbi:hypothetical protein BN2475_480023 [Paraburkholderia ribeironis]|uniref:Uncharacterized protein n=1 Tax=Paraburkholderia ribeironis TaxID=1247936 RepID=A0A1N7SB20_9BURK|nr:hypothetical protein [Paraburkholderia ribeironis]SIT44584.1 hypothetical protein BN2475_480023 [Paraburkholderia ribeironis]